MTYPYTTGSSQVGSIRPDLSSADSDLSTYRVKALALSSGCSAASDWLHANGSVVTSNDWENRQVTSRWTSTLRGTRGNFRIITSKELNAKVLRDHDMERQHPRKLTSIRDIDLVTQNDMNIMHKRKNEHPSHVTSHKNTTGQTVHCCLVIQGRQEHR
eukprot:6175194-Pleurochrysis_carterae.AAC.1